MKPLPDSVEAEKRLEALMDEMQAQTDRGVAIVGAAWVEEAMSAAIESFIYSDTTASKRLFGTSGPLAAFSIETLVFFGQKVGDGGHIFARIEQRA